MMGRLRKTAVLSAVVIGRLSLTSVSVQAQDVQESTSIVEELTARASIKKQLTNDIIRNDVGKGSYLNNKKINV